MVASPTRILRNSTEAPGATDGTGRFVRGLVLPVLLVVANGILLTPGN